MWYASLCYWVDLFTRFKVQTWFCFALGFGSFVWIVARADISGLSLHSGERLLLAIVKVDLRQLNAKKLLRNFD
jgi:hypothetical protein